MSTKFVLNSRHLCWLNNAESEINIKEMCKFNHEYMKTKTENCTVSLMSLYVIWTLSQRRFFINHNKYLYGM